MSESVEAWVQTLPTEVLAKAARGEVDLNEVCHYELAQRGLSKSGEHVGFLAAFREWKLHWGGST